MLRRCLSVVLVGLLFVPVSVSADPQSPPPPKSSSKTGRILWTVAGIAAGFGAGVMIGLHVFDDAVDSDRKVWTTAIVGAAGGGLLGNLIGRSVSKSSSTNSAPRSSPRLPFATPLATVSLGNADTTADSELRRRVREVSSPGAPCRAEPSICGTLLKD